jgi:hypothetical protein
MWMMGGRVGGTAGVGCGTGVAGVTGGGGVVAVGAVDTAGGVDAAEATGIVGTADVVGTACVEAKGTPCTELGAPDGWGRGTVVTCGGAGNPGGGARVDGEPRPVSREADEEP